jgi:hypothetical protein
MFVINHQPEQEILPGPVRDELVAWLDSVSKVRRFGARLRPPEDATVIRRRGGEVIVTDGPFAEPTEWIGGFDVLDVETTQEAVEIASRHPGAGDGGRVEVRAAWPLDIRVEVIR